MGNRCAPGRTHHRRMGRAARMVPASESVWIVLFTGFVSLIYDGRADCGIEMK